MHKILFIFSWLVVGGEETELRLLAEHIDPNLYKLDVVACFRKPGMPEQTHNQLKALGIVPDTTPYTLSFEDTVGYLAEKIPAYDLIVACQAVPDVYPALERLLPDERPPLIEHGGLVEEALAGPKHFTSRYVGVCATIRAAAAAVLPNRPAHAIEIPSMVDLSEFEQSQRSGVRRELALTDDEIASVWVGRLDRKKRVEDFIDAAAIVSRKHEKARFFVIGGPDAFMPEYAQELMERARELGLEQLIGFLGDRPDVARLLSGMDIFTWLSKGEGMPHVISEAGAACLPVIATRDNGSEEQIKDYETGIFVPYASPVEVASAICSLIEDPALRRQLGSALRAHVEHEYSVQKLVPRWEALFDEVIAESSERRRPK